jgi:inorganic pyrophosphatase
MIYPGDYGMIPQTHYDDGDPLDVLILGNEATFTGCIVDVRPIGMFRMLDKGDHDDKVLAVPVGNPFFRNFHDLIDVPPHFLDEVAHFFTVYKDLEGTRTHPLGWEPVEVARQCIMRGIQMYKEKQEAEKAERQAG